MGAIGVCCGTLLVACQPSDPDVLVGLATENYQAGDHRTAIIHLKNALIVDPNSASARHLLGQVLLVVGESDDALIELYRARDLGAPSDAVARDISRALLHQQQYDAALKELTAGDIEADAESLVMLGEAYLGLEQFADADTAFDRALLDDPTVPQAHLGKASVARAIGQRSEAIEIVRRLLEQNPEHVPAWLALGAVLLEDRDFDGAREAYRQALAYTATEGQRNYRLTAMAGQVESDLGRQALDDAEDSVAVMLQEFSRHPVALYLRARVAFLRGDYQTARVDLNSILRIQPDHPPTQVLLGAVNYAEGNFAQAEIYLSGALKHYPDNILVRRLLAGSRFWLSGPREALDILRSSLRGADPDTDLLILVGQLSLMAGDLESGVDYLERVAATAPEDPVLQLQLAAGYVAAGQPDKAVELLEGLHAPGVDFQKRIFLLTVAYLRNDDPQGAIRVTDRYLARNRNDPFALSLSAAAHVAAGETEVARNTLFRVTELTPNSHVGWLMLARLEHQREQYDSAERYYLRVLELRPNNLAAMVGRARLAYVRGDRDQARALLIQAREHHPKTLEPLFGLVRLSLEQGDLDDARDAAEEAVSIAPRNPEALNVLGTVLMHAESYHAALNLFGKAVVAMPESAKYLHNRARAELAIDSNREALLSLRGAWALAPDDPAIAVDLAAQEITSGNLNAAGSIARQIRAKDPQSPTADLIEGDVFMSRGDYQAASRNFERAMQAEPNRALVSRLYHTRKQAEDPAPEQILAEWLETDPSDLHIRLILGQHHQSGGDDDEAMRQYQLILEADPDHAVALNNLAWVYHDRGNKDSALELAERAHALKPDDASITDTLGWFLVEAGEHQRGALLLREAATSSPAGDIQYHLAVALVGLGQVDDGRQMLEQLLESESQFESRADAEKLLNTL